MLAIPAPKARYCHTWRSLRILMSGGGTGCWHALCEMPYCAEIVIVKKFTSWTESF